jgi:hypothetical protein
VLATLGGRAGRVLGFDGDVGTLGDLAGSVEWLKMSANVWMAASWDWPSLAKGTAGAGCCRACTRFNAAFVAASADEVFGTAQWCGKNSTVLAMRLARVFDTYIQWQR